MRFPFGFKGTLDTSSSHSEGGSSAKAAKSSKDNGEIICTGYRPFSDFDSPRRSPIPPPRQNNQASTSKSTTNGVIPKDKKVQVDSATKNKVQQKQVEKAKTTKVVDTTKEQKQQKDAAKVAQKAEEKVRAQKLKEQKELDKKKEQQLKEQKQKESKIKEKDKKQKATKSEKNSSSIFAESSKSSSNSKLKAKKGKAPGTPPASGGVATINPIILAREQEKANRNKNKSKTTASIPDKAKTAVEDDKNKTKSLPNLTSPDLDDYENNQPDDGSISVVSGKTVKASPSDDDNKKSTLIFMTEDHGNNESNDYETINDYQTENAAPKVKETKNEQQNGSRVQNNYSNEYSSHAASIFFNSDYESTQQQTRAYRYRNDDDNASQTSA